MEKNGNDLTNAQMMVNETNVNLGIIENSACKCQNCNNVKIEEDNLDEMQIEAMFEDLLN